MLIHNKVRESFVSIEVTNVNKDCEDEPGCSEQKKIEDSLLYDYTPEKCDNKSESVNNCLGCDFKTDHEACARNLACWWRLLPYVITVRWPQSIFGFIKNSRKIRRWCSLRTSKEIVKTIIRDLFKYIFLFFWLIQIKDYLVLNIFVSDQKIEEFWLGLKTSMLNFYNNCVIKRPIDTWSNNLNVFQKHKNYSSIEKHIINYISLYALDLMRFHDEYHIHPCYQYAALG